MVVTGSVTCPEALGCIVHQKSRSSLDASSQNCQMIPRRRKERISHVRAVMTILWERFAYAGSVSTLNPEIQKKRKQKSHQGFTLAKIPSPRLLHKLRSTRERKSCALHAFRLHQQRHPSSCMRPRRVGTRNIWIRFSCLHSTPKSPATHAAGIGGTRQLLTHFY